MSLEAGKYLARGSAGCVYSPGFTCSSRAEVSKVLFKEKDAQAELDLGKRAQELDPNHVQSVVPNQMCQKTWADVSSEKGSSKCAEHFKPKPNQPVWILQSEGVYTDVDSALYQKLNVSNAQHLAKGYINIILGLQFFHTNLLIHNDIHQTNVVVKPTRASKTGNPMKLIDFGQSMDLRPFLISQTAATQKQAYLEDYFLNRYTRKRFTPLQGIQWYILFHLPEVFQLQIDQVPLFVKRIIKQQEMTFTQFVDQFKTLRLNSTWRNPGQLESILVDNVTVVVKSRDTKAFVESMVLHDIMALWSLLDQVLTGVSKTFMNSSTQQKQYLQFLNSVQVVSQSMQTQILHPDVQVSGSHVPQNAWATSLQTAFTKLQRKTSPGKQFQKIESQEWYQNIIDHMYDNIMRGLTIGLDDSRDRFSRRDLHAVHLQINVQQRARQAPQFLTIVQVGSLGRNRNNMRQQDLFENIAIFRTCQQLDLRRRQFGKGFIRRSKNCGGPQIANGIHKSSNL